MHFVFLSSIVRPIKRARKPSVFDDASSIAMDNFHSKSPENGKNVTCKPSVPDHNSGLNANNFDSKLLRTRENAKEKLSRKISVPDDSSSITTDSLDSKSHKVKESLVTDKAKSPNRPKKRVILLSLIVMVICMHV